MARGKSLFNFGNYTFSSWARRGIANAIAPNGSSLVRAQLPLSVSLNNEPVPQSVEILGPADISGILRNAIVRSEPLNGNYNFEWNMLPYVEFYDEDFAWRYTPDAPDSNGGNLRPWLALVVLQVNEYSELPVNQGALPAIRVQTAALPAAAELHLWAHMHTGEHAGVTGGSLDDILLQIAGNFPKDPDGVTCRIVSPRRLEKQTLYQAFLIPSFEAGRLAGLGEKYSSIPARLPAWSDANRPATLDFPVYYQWKFATTNVDFEDLVSKMKAASANPQVGIRDMNISKPGYVKANGIPNVGIPKIAGTANPNLMGLEGALRTPATVSTPYIADGVSDDFQKDIASLLSLYDQASTSDTPYQFASDTDPVLTIPLYGQPYSNPKGSAVLATLADKTGWFANINFDPRNRVAAGLGTQVIQSEQETLMQSAWFQLQALQEARNQFAAVGSIMNRLVDRLANVNLVPNEDFVSMARNMTSRVKDATSTTSILQQLKVSSTPKALINSASRRIMRTNSNLTIKLGVNQSQPGVVSSLKLVNSNLSGAVLLKYRFVFTPIKLLPILIVGQPTAFDLAFQDFTARVPGVTDPKPIVVFPFNQAQLSLQASIKSAPNRLLKNRLDIPAATASIGIPRFSTSAAAAAKAPAEFLGQPFFTQPMYEPLWKLDKEWFLPNMNLIENNTITLLETNTIFINSYMLGLNQEMGREMLWRQFPADLSATFFRNFWQANDGALVPTTFDIDLVKSWIGKPSPPRQSGGAAAKLVLTLRGELLRKFPNTIIFAASFQRDKTTGKLLPPAASDFKFPTFRADLPPDLQFLGFDLTVTEVLSENSFGGTSNTRAWYFIIMEPVGEPRFGLDQAFRPGDPANPSVYSRNDLSWDHLMNPGLPDFLTAADKPAINGSPDAVADKALWGMNAAAMAALLFQQPFAMVIKATDMITLQKN